MKFPVFVFVSVLKCEDSRLLQIIIVTEISALHEVLCLYYNTYNKSCKNTTHIIIIEKLKLRLKHKTTMFLLIIN